MLMKPKLRYQCQWDPLSKTDARHGAYPQLLTLPQPRHLLLISIDRLLSMMGVFRRRASGVVYLRGKLVPAFQGECVRHVCLRGNRRIGGNVVRGRFLVRSGNEREDFAALETRTSNGHDCAALLWRREG